LSFIRHWAFAIRHSAGSSAKSGLQTPIPALALVEIEMLNAAPNLFDRVCALLIIQGTRAEKLRIADCGLRIPSGGVSLGFATGLPGMRLSADMLGEIINLQLGQARVDMAGCGFAAFVFNPQSAIINPQSCDFFSR
jgi:hypothetical protein